MASSTRSVSDRSVEKSYIVWYTFSTKIEHKLDINITPVTRKATGILERLMNTILKGGKNLLRNGNYVYIHVGERNARKKLIVHTDTFMDSAIEFYADKKKKNERKEQTSFDQKNFKTTMLSTVDMYSYVKDFRK